MTGLFRNGLIIMMAWSGFAFAFSSRASSFATETNQMTSSVAVFEQPKTLAELLALPPKQLESVDIAVMNLLCAEGLQGSERLDALQLLKTLDAWTIWIGEVTRRNYHRFRENPKEFRNSLGDYRMAFLSATLQQDLGVRYDPERAVPQIKLGPSAEPLDIFFANSKDIFIHGLLGNNRFGTCSSMPVLFVAIARRLGYPVNLATSKGHLFVRYEEGAQHFDVEATSPGYNVYQDDHYKNWPFPTADNEVKEERYFEPLNAQETLAAFLSMRCACLMAVDKIEEARDTMALAHRYAPDVAAYKNMLDGLEKDAASARIRANWEELSAEISNLELPVGDKFEYFRDKKIALHIYLLQTGDLNGSQKALEQLKTELASQSSLDGSYRISAMADSPSPQPTPIQVVILPETIKYVSPDGRSLELSVQSEEQINSFIHEQRIFDKVAELQFRERRAHGLPQLPWEAMRPSGIQTPRGVPREIALQDVESKLDETLKAFQQDDFQGTPQIPQVEPSPQQNLSPQAQAALSLINNLNMGSQQRQNGNIFTPPSALKEADVTATGLPPQVQNVMDFMNSLNESKRQLELLSQMPTTNMQSPKKAPK